jgi:hypothetical protein
VANAGQTAEEYYVNKPFFVDFRSAMWQTA